MAMLKWILIILGVFMSPLVLQAANFTGLGDFPGGSFNSAALEISADGTTVIGRGHSARGREAFRWTSEMGMTVLGVLSEEALPGGVPGGTPFLSDAHGVSSDGNTVVGLGVSINGSEAYRWTSETGMVGLGDLAGGDFFSNARGVSEDGNTVVGQSESSNGREAFRWTSETGMVGLGDLPGGSFPDIGTEFESSAAAISADGTTIVGQGVSTNGREAFRWTSETGMIGLGDLPGGRFFSLASGVSVDGSTVVGESWSAEDIQAFRWTQETGMVGLGDLPGGDTYSLAHGVSTDGSMVVGRGTSDRGAEAFLWTEQEGMQSMESFLINNHGLTESLAGWELIDAFDLSADGLTFIGWGRNPLGDNEAWIARLGSPNPIVPEPGTILLFGTGTFGVMAWRLKQRGKF